MPTHQDEVQPSIFQTRVSAIPLISASLCPWIHTGSFPAGAAGYYDPGRPAAPAAPYRTASRQNINVNECPEQLPVEEEEEEG